MKKKSKPRIKNTNELYFGDEPLLENNDNFSLVKCLNWYSNNIDYPTAKNYTLKFIKNSDKYTKQDLSKISSISDKYFSTLGYVCRIKERNDILSDSQNEWVNNKIKTLIRNHSKQEIIPIIKKNEKYNIVDEYIGDIDEQIEKFIKTKSHSFNCYEYYLTKNIKPSYIKEINYYVQKYLDEVGLVITKQDEQLNEAYSHYKKKELLNYQNFLIAIINDGNRILENNKKEKKPRKKRKISADKKVSKLKYLKEYNELKLKSIIPINIIGANILIVYDIKYKKLGIYYSKDMNGFDVKGTTLLNINEDISKSKTIRKPEEFLMEASKITKTSVKKFFENIKTKEFLLTGRINENIILLKTFR